MFFMSSLQINYMKKLFLSILLISTGIFELAQAQISVHFNIGTQPLWGPVGYDYVQYYYIPDIDAYYDVPNRQYVYLDGGRWITRRSLPPQYRTIDLYTVHKEVINEPTPWMHHDRYRTQYIQYKGRHDQQIIRDSREQRYWENPRHPNHNQWKGNPGKGHSKDKGYKHGNGHGRGHDKGHGRGHGKN
jgi:hypothetical protein